MQQKVFLVPPKLQVAPTMRSISYPSHLSTIPIKACLEAHPFVTFKTRQHRPKYFVHAARTVKNNDFLPTAVPTAGFRAVIMVSAQISLHEIHSCKQSYSTDEVTHTFPYNSQLLNFAQSFKFIFQGGGHPHFPLQHLIAIVSLG